MFFLIRCTFWLTIVFHAMTWPSEPSGQAGGIQDQMVKAATGLAGDLATSAATMAAAKLEAGCAKAPSACLTVAARLPQIVATETAQSARNVDVVPPKRPMKLAEGESSRPASGHKAPVQHN